MESQGQFANVSCPYPFISELSVPARDGFTSQRVCMHVPMGGENVSCCLPCPVADWRIYSTGFNVDLVRWFGLATLILFLFLAITYMVLPVIETRRHYLTIAPLVGLAIRACADPITANDWTTSHSCAASATFLYYGAWVVILSGFFHSLSLYLHLCWEIDLGDKFMYSSLVGIFGCSEALVPVVFYVSGVAYQVGKVCVAAWRACGVYSSACPASLSPSSFLSSDIASTVSSIYLELCTQLSMRAATRRLNRLDRRRHPTPTGQARARQVSSKIWHVLQPQWRAVSLLLVIIFYTVFLAQTSLRAFSPDDYTADKVLPWATCLVNSHGASDACTHLADSLGLGPSEPMIRTAWILLSLSGLIGFLCVVRWSMLQGWMAGLRRQRTVYSEWRACRGDEDALTDIERAPTPGQPSYQYHPLDKPACTQCALPVSHTYCSTPNQPQ
ncbi:hypothetical protein BJX62DRAFT_252478 [Aspergillus germanicus]